jgi:hypothetical protein
MLPPAHVPWTPYTVPWRLGTSVSIAPSNRSPNSDSFARSWNGNRVPSSRPDEGGVTPAITPNWSTSRRVTMPE